MPKQTSDNITDISSSHVSAINAIDHAISLMSSALSVSRYSIRKTSHTYKEMRRDAPYVIHKTSLPNTQILVNRNYKPVGSNEPTGGELAKYEEFKNLHTHLSREQVEPLNCPQHDYYYLFNDSCSPWSNRASAEAYRRKLLLLREILSDLNP